MKMIELQAEERRQQHEERKHGWELETMDRKGQHDAAMFKAKQQQANSKESRANG